jgi:RimJ/RimL family protein N-acetyltransferase
MLSFRPVKPSDMKILFEWINDPLDRAMSLSKEPVTWETHQRWFDARLSKPDPMLYVVDEGCVPVGTFRFDGDEISYSVAPEHRRRGIATAMLTIVREQFGCRIARCKPENIASIKAAKRAGHTVEFHMTAIEILRVRYGITQFAGMLGPEYALFEPEEQARIVLEWLERKNSVALEAIDNAQLRSDVEDPSA